jgi:Fe-S-cluster containining protein
MPRSSGAASPSTSHLDLSLLNGFSFRCRPDCGLCCFTSPAVSEGERRKLIQLDPNVPFEELTTGEGDKENEFAHVSDQGDGGACHFLHGLRCRAYGARPFPCQSFPLMVHIGRTAQATLVLSCPGLDLNGLPGWAGARPPQGAPRGLDEEIRATKAEWAQRGGAGVVSGLTPLRRRGSPRVRHALRTFDWEAMRSHLIPNLPLPGPEDFPADAPPGADEPLDQLPLFFDEVYGRVALREREGGWECLPLRESGGSEAPLGLFPGPDTPPKLLPDAETLLRGYLGYVVRREFFVSLVQELCEDQGESDPTVVARDVLVDLGSQVMARAGVRAKLLGQGGERLDAPDILRGVRAVDADFLDQETVGEQL